ncbi:MRP-L47-domain-containing protein [Gonapodya prolifera JEL478]|uniref:Large ribosomal subunit protein uL29m n=1 Tax=Gonapodya prolifera (strain JEL478) TaxID=1344416 RepID=A0A139APN5_GONPJ|nr:MRP-L47-domain-containing protein [Gonapodya prolifera JEL478]|eukprot:KXS18692.1 MRP-L47-domain-containing protein [Gonapodya prolifera JEL478]
MPPSNRIPLMFSRGFFSRFSSQSRPFNTASSPIAPSPAATSLRTQHMMGHLQLRRRTRIGALQMDSGVHREDVQRTYSTTTGPAPRRNANGLISANESSKRRRRHFGTTSIAKGLEEFFDNADGWLWQKDNAKFGRFWTHSELRRKSFDDLHKLWFVCLKEKNLLYSQMEEARRFQLQFPHKERLRTVKVTMRNIKFVLGERKKVWAQVQNVLDKHQAIIASKQAEPPENPLQSESSPFADVDVEEAVLEKLKELSLSTKMSPGEIAKRKRNLKRREGVHKLRGRALQAYKAKLNRVVLIEPADIIERMTRPDDAQDMSLVA